MGFGARAPPKRGRKCEFKGENWLYLENPKPSQAVASIGGETVRTVFGTGVSNVGRGTISHRPEGHLAGTSESRHPGQVYFRLCPRPQTTFPRCKGPLTQVLGGYGLTQNST